MSSPAVVEKTDGRVRVCIDPLHLNKALKRSHYPLPVIDEILPELSEAKLFTKIDFKDGFLQVELYQESSELTNSRHLGDDIVGSECRSVYLQPRSTSNRSLIRT